ncbi:MAG: nitroreductase [Steroidobacteraceae bacterium]|jgi:nitroreductase|nr:nitroreductase [Steroidobacteraceae bacterium]
MTTVTEALQRRISIRAFLPDPLPRQAVHDVLERARWAPSGGNVQPWKVIAVAGAERDAVIALAQAAHAAGAPSEEGDDPVYPANLWEPYRSRRFKVGEDLYALLQIPRTDRPGRLRQFARNYQFFGAPVALFLVIDRRMGRGQWAHLGMFMQSIALAAVEAGLGTCMQEAWATLRRSLAAHFALAQDEMVYCAIALGRPDPAAAVNRLRSERVAVEDFTTFRGFT